MRRTLADAARAIVALAALFAGVMPAAAQNRGLITKPIDDTRLVTLTGNTRPEASAANDRGTVADSLPITHMLLLLRRSATREAALDQTIDDLQDPNSPDYHHRLPAAEFRARFGAAASDLATVTGWLAGQGFHVNSAYGATIDFSNTAGQVRAAFHTEIHNLDVDGVAHIANISDLKIPEALAPAVAGIVSLNDFRPAPQYTFTARCASEAVLAGICYALVPADLATIYDPAAVSCRGGRQGSNDRRYRGFESLQRQRLAHFPLDIWPRPIFRVVPANPSEAAARRQ
jgi:pro-kumamolisin-like protein